MLNLSMFVSLVEDVFTEHEDEKSCDVQILVSVEKQGDNYKWKEEDLRNLDSDERG